MVADGYCYKTLLGGYTLFCILIMYKFMDSAEDHVRTDVFRIRSGGLSIRLAELEDRIFKKLLDASLEVCDFFSVVCGKN